MNKKAKKEEMTSRERVQAAFSFREMDRVPFNYKDNPGINGILKKHLGLSPGDQEGLLQKLNIDFRALPVPYMGNRLHAEIPGLRVNPAWGTRTRWVSHDNGGYWEYCDFPLQEMTMEDALTWPMPDPDDFDYSGIRDFCKRNANYAVFFGSGGWLDIMNTLGYFTGMENMYVGLAVGDKAILAFLDRQRDILLEVTRRTIEAGEGDIAFLVTGEDLGTQKGPMISIDLFRRVLRPRHQQFINLARKFDLTVMIHSCGSSSWAFEDFLEMGINAVETLQPEAADMKPEYLKDRFGGRLTMQGCISTAGPLAYGSPDDVRENVRDTLDLMKPTRGYILAPTHMIQDNTPAENVLAMYDAAMEYGFY